MDLSKLKSRVLISVTLIAFLWFGIFNLPSWVFLLVIVALVGRGLYEFFDMVARKNILVYRYFGIVIGCLIPVFMYLQFEPTEGTEFMLMTAVCLAVFILQFRRRKTEQALVGIATTVFGIFYISWLFSFMIKLRFMPPHGFDGRFLVLYLLLVTKSGDIAAYFIGTYFGKHQLIPRISPKKSVEGTVGGLIASFLAAVIFRGFLPSVNITHIFILGFLLSILSQIGDLSESLIKRDCKVKDSGTFFPGLGGMLDLIDSLLFTTPIFYFYLRLLPV
ncbi:MAG: phosphatidate cytidylyltransferase [Candidatus Omnitrophica bacterium]|nr:phosphatidate cytidylyltransferase [Candidatus Omnitrophota bacterium]